MTYQACNAIRGRRALQLAHCQRGNELIEFTLLAPLIFLVFFALMEFAIAMYDQGILIHSARIGAREASLFWVDVTQITPDSDPGDDQRLSTTEVSSQISNWLDRFLITLMGESPSVEFQDQPLGSFASTLPVDAGDEVSVAVALDYTAPLTSALSSLIQLDMTALGVMRVE